LAASNTTMFISSGRKLLANMDYAIHLTRLISKTPFIKPLHAHKYMKWEKRFADILLKKTGAMCSSS